MKKNAAVLTGLMMIALFSVSGASANDARGYLGFQLGVADLEAEDLNIGLARIGIKYPNNLAIEARYGIGLGSKTKDGVEREVDRVLGLYGAYYFDVSESVSLYGIAGLSEIVVESKGTGDAEKIHEDGLSYGLGAEFRGFNLEWIQYVDSDQARARAVAIGYNYHF